VILDKSVYNGKQKGFELHFSEVWDYVKSILGQIKAWIKNLKKKEVRK
jgi:hypothetical protein